MQSNSTMCMVFADKKGTVYDYPGKMPLLRTGNRFIAPCREELVRLPFGSYLFTLDDRFPVCHENNSKGYSVVTDDGQGRPVQAVASFLSSGYLRTYLPAYDNKEGAVPLPLWAYAGVVFVDGDFYVPAMRIDEDPRSDPQIHQDTALLTRGITVMKQRFPDNRLVKQLSRCAVEYNCLCARNFFLSRHEAPLPTSPGCNSQCIGCLSYQDESSGFQASQQRLKFKPTPGEISQVILHHVEHVDNAVASFGQGCEGEPLLRGNDLVQAVSSVREKTDRGTININTNGSLPDVVRELAHAGLDSIRVSMNSPTEKYYTPYHKPAGYTYKDVMKTLETALKCGLFVSINLFFMPGFTDMISEVESLKRFLNDFPVNMIQTRNLNIDPDLYFDSIGYEESEPVGIARLVTILKNDYPDMKLGYYNPSVKQDYQK